MGYLHICNLYREQDILLFKECYAMEKIHGSSAHVSWNGQEVHFFAGGESHVNFVALFDVEQLKSKFIEKIGAEKAIVYGEVYGASQQGMSATYGKALKFIAFDVQVGDCWLSVPNAENVAVYVGLEFVHYQQIPTNIAAIDAARDTDSVQAIRNGMGPGKRREGVVLRPLIEVTKNNGARIIAKHKRKEFSERQNEPKVMDPEKLAVLQGAQAVADEWVISMRLEHVLQKHPEAINMEHTLILVKAMIEDVYREAKGEIIESKEVSTAIGRKTAELWKAKLKKDLGSKE